MRAALGYTAASLPTGVGAEARLLAVVCALRVRRSGWAPLPGGLVGSLRLAAPGRAVGELAESGWFEAAGPGRCGSGVWVAELAGRPGGLRAGQWALRMLARPGVAALQVPGRLAALAVAAWAEGPGEPFVLDAAQVARSCGLTVDQFTGRLMSVRDAGVVAGWVLSANGLLTCRAV
ncbi:hypothetical protein [Kitasatospora sp. NPDC051914]|uniref:hypothetical protein n=1 Tax=Kitasatospora sp. NPDC051914 TaxID=3154945 RepID=UPI00341477A4